MEIGILTYHRAENYGALLQAYALKTYLTQQGHEVSFVDYWPLYHVEHYRIFSSSYFKTRNLKGKVFYLFWFLFWGKTRYSRKRKLTRFMRERLNVPQVIKYQFNDDVCNEFDAVIYGSDQIWRKQEFESFSGYNPWYFGSDNVKSPIKISYAASMGKTTAIGDDERKQLALLLKNFNRISVREKDLQQLVISLGFVSELVIDPVFLLSKDHWSSLFPENGKREKPYIFYYNLLSSPESDRYVAFLQEKTGLPVKEISLLFDRKHISGRYIHSASVEEFLYLIANADYVVSNSFHGIAFSIIFRKEFFVLGLNDRSSRITSLLERCGLDDRLIKPDNMKEELGYIDYESVQSKLSNYIDLSKLFLTEIDEK